MVGTLAIGTSAEDAVLEISPTLLKRGDAWSFAVMGSGPAHVSVSDPLIDTDVEVFEATTEPETVDVSMSFFGLTFEIPVRWPPSLRHGKP